MSNLLICIEMWSEMLEANCNIDVIYTDFSKAFDCVSHVKLLQKIRSVGTVGYTCAWIRSFLKDRSPKVPVDDAYSSFTKLKFGIPQGLVLGPILFITFINDMADIIESTCQLFADDAKISVKLTLMMTVCSTNLAWQDFLNGQNCGNCHNSSHWSQQ